MPSIAAIASGDDRFLILVQALSYVDTAIPGSNLIATLSSHSAELTVFAPTDAAFGQLAVDLGFHGNPSDEDAVVSFLTTAVPAETLKTVILYHVSAGALTANEVAALESIPTLAGVNIGTDLPTLVDAEPDLIDPSLVQTDIIATNGVIHAIDRVLLPIDLPGNDAPTITDIVAASGEFDSNGRDFDLLLQAVTAAGLAGALDDPEADLTVFAPNDAAFIKLAKTLGFEGSGEGDAFAYIVDALTLLSGGGDPIPLLQSILTYHVAPESLQASQVLASDSIETLLGPALGVNGTRLVDAEPDLANPGIIATDIQAANGIVHVINGVLLPTDLPTFGGADGAELVIASDEANVLFTGKGRDLIAANGGDDVIGAGAGSDLVLGEAGSDKLLGGLGADRLDGGASRDFVFGGKGADVLIGGAGGDFLTGGDGRDRFVFATGDGRDLISDFEVGEDRIDLSGTTYDSFDDISGRISGSIGFTVISLGNGDSIALAGVRPRDLGADDFLFA